MSAELDHNQKRILSQTAERAYRFLAAQARGRGEEWDMSSKASGEWRRVEVGKAVGKAGLRCCSQADYGAVRGHFLNLLGETGQAFKAIVHGDPEANQRRQVEWKIGQECRKLGKPATYAHGICKQRFHGLHIFDASVKQLWGVFYALEAFRKKQDHKKPQAA